MLTLYKNTLSFLFKILFGGGCRHFPSCSEYAAEAISIHGILKGSILSVRRLARCHPRGTHGFDPVPPRLHNN